MFHMSHGWALSLTGPSWSFWFWPSLNSPISVDWVWVVRSRELERRSSLMNWVAVSSTSILGGDLAGSWCGRSWERRLKASLSRSRRRRSHSLHLELSFSFITFSKPGVITLEFNVSHFYIFLCLYLSGVSWSSSLEACVRVWTETETWKYYHWFPTPC